MAFIQDPTMFKHISSSLSYARGFVSRRYQSSKAGSLVKTQKGQSIARHGSNSEAGIHEHIETGRKGYFVPRVPSTDYIPTTEVQTEGLFAGYRPLFLGNSSFRAESSPNALDNFFTSFANIKISDGSKDSSELEMQDILEDLKRDNAQLNLKNSKGKNRKPIIPWDASISGMVYNDHPFKDVPKNVVSKLKPFKMVRLERVGDLKKSAQAASTIRLKFHNSSVSDEPEMVNLLNVLNSRRLSRLRKGEISKAHRDSLMQSRQDYEKEFKTLAFKHKFIKSDRKVFKNESDKLNRMLAKEFYKQTNLSIRSESSDADLPLYIYVNKSIVSKRLFRSFLRKWLTDHVEPVLSTILTAYDNQEQANRFEGKVTLKIENMVQEVSKHIPSVYFTGNSVDCVVQSSPVPGFKRLHWLKATRRKTLFWGKNMDRDYLFTLDKNYNVTRSGVKYMRYPNNLNWRTFDEAFSEWDYHA